MIRPRGKASRIYKQIFSFEGKTSQKRQGSRESTGEGQSNKKMNILKSRDISLNPTTRSTKQ